MEPPPPPGGGQHPAQRGKFKPRKKPAPRQRPATGGAARGGRSSSGRQHPGVSGGRGLGVGGSAAGTGHAGAAGGGDPTHRQHSAARGRSGGRGGRGGRGRGRGRGQVIIPHGQVFFTGQAAAPDGAGKRGGAASAAVAVGTGGAEAAPVAPRAGGVWTAATAGPSHKPSSFSTGGGGGSGATARTGEGEETVVGEVSGGGVGSMAIERLAKSTAGGLGRVGGGEGPGWFDGEGEDGPKEDLPQSAFTYDSDDSSSDDGAVGRSKSGDRGQGRAKAGGRGGSGIQPFQLPFPQRHRFTNSDGIFAEEKKTPDHVVSSSISPPSMSASQQESTAERDPPLTSPFVDDPTIKSEEDNYQNWIMFKFPTRLPRLHPMCTIGGRAAADAAVATGGGGARVKIEPGGGGGMNDPMFVGSSDSAMVMEGSAGADGRTNEADSAGDSATMSSSGCYDDTLKDIGAGRYGRILVYKSGKTVLVVGGGGDGSPEVRMQVTEGLQCGFFQQAVALDAEQGTFIPLGQVTKSVVITPDIDGAFDQ